MPDHILPFLDPGSLRFERSDGGLLSLTVDDGGTEQHYPRIDVYRTYPLSAPDELVSLREPDGDEIGIIETLEDLDGPARRLLDEQLERRYFCPAIDDIVSVKEEFGYSYWEVETDAGSRRFTVQSGKSNILSIGDARLLIIDVDGNRFELTDYRRLPTATVRILESLF